MKGIVQISIIIIFLISSCKSELKVMHFYSLDEYTGGFKDLALDLDSNGKLKLTVLVFISDSINEEGTELVAKTIIYTGKWCLKKKQIKVIINELKDTNDLIFNDPNYLFLKKKPTIQFSKAQDTSYIYGIPCIRVKNK